MMLAPAAAALLRQRARRGARVGICQVSALTQPPPAASPPGAVAAMLMLPRVDYFCRYLRRASRCRRLPAF